MDKKTIFPAVTIALMSCVALMLTVIGGLYAYNTFASDAQPVAAQTDRGPSWTATSLRIGGNTDYLCVIKDVENPFEEGGPASQLVVYEIRQKGNGRAELFFVAARLLEYDFQVPDHSDQAATGKNWSPIGVKEAIEKEKAKRK